MFTAYLDASGSGKENKHSYVLTVGGFIFSALNVLDFDEDWRKALADEGVRIFHMVDFAHSKGEFAQWEGDEARRANFLDRLCTVIQKYARHSLSYSVLLEDYEKIDLGYMFHEYLGEPYPLCGLSCVTGMEEWMAAKGYRSPPLYIFEDGDTFKTEFKRLLERANKREAWFEPKSTSPLQAADFIAWEHTKAFTEIATGTFQNFRRSLEKLREISNSGNLFRAEELEDFCRSHKIPIPR